VDLTAPGGTFSNPIYSTWGYYLYGTIYSEYEYMQGTSMSTPYVSGIAALLIADGVSPRDVRYRLTSTAVDLGSSGKDDYYGHGLVDAYGALLGKKLEKPYVFAANIENGNLYVKSEMIKVNDDGSYNLNKVVAEEVYIVGWRDVNENQKIDAGDYYGEYSSTINISENSQYAASFNMYYVSESSSTSMEVKGIPEVETK
jgi:serine protease